MNVLILGASGLIGSATTQELIKQGHSVTALARSLTMPRRRMPKARWIEADLSKMSMPDQWTPLLAGIEAVVNCAGVLQDGAHDDVAAVQDAAMRALYKAAPAAMLIVQISARTNRTVADLKFLATKRTADEALAQSGLPFVILRPAIVVGRHAYGGTALLRGLAALPFVAPLASPSTPMQFAALDDVVEAVAEAIAGKIPPGADIEIAGAKTYTLSDAVARHRQWLGLPPVHVARIPGWLARVVACGADALGRLGWRSPLRSTAIATAAGGVTAGRVERQWRGLDDVLEAYPAGVGDLWFARLYLLKPVVLGALSLFWLASGIIALIKFDASAAHLEAAGLGATAAAGLTLVTSIADIALGALVLVRRRAAAALKGMILLSLSYLAVATITTPALWLDPLGPLVKVLPSIALALVALATLDDR